MHKKIVFLIILVIWIIPTCLAAQDIPASVKSKLNSKGFNIFPTAVYCTGDISIGVRFATDEQPEKVREWYKAQYPKWAVLDQYGSWILYDGPPGAGMGQVMSGKQILIKKTEQLPSWHSLSSNMTTEIMASFPD